jgi:hypothetical protein
VKFAVATKKKLKAKISLQGPPGSGKTRSALAIGKRLAGGDMSKVAVLDTEERSASLYSNDFQFVEPSPRISEPFHPDKVIQFLEGCVAAGLEVAIVDSATHFWNGPGGMLELVDEEVRNQKAKGWKTDSHSAWKEVDKVYKRFVRALISAPIHVIICLRAKTEVVKDIDEKGKQVVRKLGMAAEMRDSFAFEMSIEGMLNTEHDLIIGKTRCPLIDGKVFHKPGAEFADLVLQWLNDGASEDEAKVQTAPESSPQVASAGGARVESMRARAIAATTREELKALYLEAKAADMSNEDKAGLMDSIKKLGAALTPTAA